MATFHEKRFLATITAAACLAGLATAQPLNKGGEQTVYTMRGEYEIKAQVDGKTYLLRRFAKDGSAYDSIVITKISGGNGEIVYADANGRKYTALSDGRLEEKVVFDSAPAIPRQSVARVKETLPTREAAPSQVRLMTVPPVVPRTMGNGLILVSNLTLPKGEDPLRMEGGLLFLTIGKDDNGKPREVVVQKVSSDWYVRTSIDNDPSVAPAFRIQDDGSVSGYRELPLSVPQLTTINRGDNSPPPGATEHGTQESYRPAPLPGPAPVAPEPDRQAAGTPVDYQGHKGRIVAQPDANGQHFYLTIDGEPGSIELESVRGSHTFFTPIGRGDINVIVGSQGKITAIDTAGREATLRDSGAVLRSDALLLPVAAVPAPAAPSSPPETVRPTLTRMSQPQAPLGSMPSGQEGSHLSIPGSAPSVGGPYSGPMSGKVECDGHPIPQNGEQVFSDLPPLKLNLIYDTSVWDDELVPNGQTQKLILRNKKPGVQKKCTVRWNVVQ